MSEVADVGYAGMNNEIGRLKVNLSNLTGEIDRMKQSHDDDRERLLAEIGAGATRYTISEQKLNELRNAWLQVCHEGNVPQYEDVTVAHPDGIRHGVRQLASQRNAERLLRKRAEQRVAELKQVLRDMLTGVDVHNERIAGRRDIPVPRIEGPVVAQARVALRDDT